MNYVYNEKTIQDFLHFVPAEQQKRFLEECGNSAVLENLAYTDTWKSPYYLHSVEKALFYLEFSRNEQGSIEISMELSPLLHQVSYEEMLEYMQIPNIYIRL